MRKQARERWEGIPRALARHSATWGFATSSLGILNPMAKRRLGLREAAASIGCRGPLPTCDPWGGGDEDSLRLSEVPRTGKGAWWAG
jgi:hypothetical protein